MPRLPWTERFASIMRSCVLSTSCDTCRRIRTITKMGGSRFEHYEFFQRRDSAHFFNRSNTFALTGGRRRTPLRIMEANRSLPGSRVSVSTPIENELQFPVVGLK